MIDEQDGLVGRRQNVSHVMIAVKDGLVDRQNVFNVITIQDGLVDRQSSTYDYCTTRLTG